MRSILLFGGAGRAGRVAARLLLEHTDARIVIGGRSHGKAAAFALFIRWRGKTRP